MIPSTILTVFSAFITFVSIATTSFTVRSFVICSGIMFAAKLGISRIGHGSGVIVKRIILVMVNETSNNETKRTVELKDKISLS